jgi:hypothetical protein
MMKLSEHFTLEEFISSETAARKLINNYPDPQSLGNLKRIAEKMEQVRALLGKPIQITSGYRCSALNKLIGSKPTSKHVQGLACDFKCPEFGTPKQIVEAIQCSDIDFDQLIFEFGSWVHFGLGAANRKQVLTINEFGTFSGIHV